MFRSGNIVSQSGHWLSDNSDIFSFDKDGFLVSMDLYVPCKNKILLMKESITLFGEVKLKDDFYVINPMLNRFFDAENKRMICSNGIPVDGDKIIEFKINNDFSMILNDGVYSGYVLNNPVRYITNKKGMFDDKNLPGIMEYDFMCEYMRIMSDNRLDELGGNIEKVISELYDYALPRFDYIESDFRRSVIKDSIDGLVDFYL